LTKMKKMKGCTPLVAAILFVGLIVSAGCVGGNGAEKEGNGAIATATMLASAQQGNATPKAMETPTIPVVTALPVEPATPSPKESKTTATPSGGKENSSEKKASPSSGINEENGSGMKEDLDDIDGLFDDNEEIIDEYDESAVPTPE